MVTTFNDATAAWDIEKCLMNPVISNTARLPLDSVPNNCSAPPKSASSGSWAAIAATAAHESNRLIKFRPGDALKRSVAEEQKTQSIFTGEDIRVVWIQGWTDTRPLTVITDRIKNGALFSIAYSKQASAVCIIFQHARTAGDFMAEETKYVRLHGHGLFGKGCVAILGEPYPENEDLRRMQPPFNERRRLTFARQQLFTNGMSEERFKRDIYNIVGEHNVQLIWLFNTGNGMLPLL